MSCMYTYHMQCWRQGKATCLLDVNISAYLKSLNFFEKALQLHACSPAVFWRVVSAFCRFSTRFSVCCNERPTALLSVVPYCFRSFPHCSGSQSLVSGSLSKALAQPRLSSRQHQPFCAPAPSTQKCACYSILVLPAYICRH